MPEGTWFSPEHRQLFLDDAGIEEVLGLTRVLHPPRRHPTNPVLRPDTPWEDRCQVYGTALFDEERNRFRIWYLTLPRDRGVRPLDTDGHLRAPHTTLAAYAESADGVHWTKPDLGQFPYDGDRHNNLLALGRDNCEGVSVLHDPRDPDPARRWKCVYWDHGSGGFEIQEGGKPYCKDGPGDGLCVAFSPEGLQWTPILENPVLARYCDTGQNLLYDPRLGKYVVFSRLGFGRKLARSESADCVHWTEPELVLECDEADGPGTQIYGAGVDLYEGLYVAMLWVYYEGRDGTIDTQLAVSRDGFAWTRVAERAVWLSLGEPDSWEGGMVRSCGRIIKRGEELFIYYCGVHGAHHGPKVAQVERKHRTAVGLLTQRRDGFVSLDAGDAPGVLTTKPFAWPGGTLHLNADARDGAVRVALVEPSGRAMPGLEASLPWRGDAADAAVRWADEALLPTPRSAVRLRVSLQRARLYAWWVET
jgi:hypothetical protein